MPYGHESPKTEDGQDGGNRRKHNFKAHIQDQSSFQRVLIWHLSREKPCESAININGEAARFT